MRRNFSNSPCPACGVVIRGNAELPFVSRKAWRDQVAEALNYNKEFIQSFGVRTRIYAFHFNECDIRNGRPVGLPSLNIIRVDDWPVMATNTNLIINEPNPVSDENDIVNVEAIDEIEMDENEDPKEMPNFVIVEISQLKLLFHQCQFCGNSINETAVHMAHKSGVFHVKYYCSKSNRRRFWSSSQKPLSPIMSASVLLNGFPIE